MTSRLYVIYGYATPLQTVLLVEYGYGTPVYHITKITFIDRKYLDIWRGNFLLFKQLYIAFCLNDFISKILVIRV